MLKKSLALVGLVAVLVLVGSSVAWTTQTQQGTTFDPGQLTSGDTIRQTLITEALPAIIRAGYDPKGFHFDKSVADLDGTMLFVPVNESVDKLRNLPALIGLLYAHEPFLLQGRIVQKGVHPIIRDAPVQSSLHRAGDLGVVRANQSCVTYFEFNSDPPFIHTGIHCESPLFGGAPPPPPGQSPPPGPGGLYEKGATLLDLICAGDPSAFGC